jgi:hypothetical protein
MNAKPDFMQVFVDKPDLKDQIQQRPGFELILGKFFSQKPDFQQVQLCTTVNCPPPLFASLCINLL